MVMNKILFFTLSLVMAITAYGQNSASVDTLQTASDSTSVGSHAEFSAASQESNVTKAEGDSAYIRNDYASAIQIYENLLKKGEAAEVYYNLGNSYYKADDIARAILNYERALLLEPGNADIRANLEIARSKTIDKVIPVPEVFFVSWTKSLINCLSVDAWAKLGIVFLVLVILSNVFAAQQKGELMERNEAIVLAPSVTVRSTPSESGTSLFILHEGRKVEIKDNSMREWKEIRLEDGKVGWVPASAIEGI